MKIGTDFNKILIAIDDSVYSHKAVRVGFALATQLNSAVGLVYVIDRSKEMVSADLGITLSQNRSAFLDNINKVMEDFISQYGGIGTVEKFTPEGIPEKEIINISKEWDARLIVMGTHGRSAVGRILTGSIAEYVIRHSAIPVLVSPPRME